MIRLGLIAKRVFDVSVALAGLVLLSPVFGVIALVVRLRLGRPMVFAQERVGKGGRPFRIYKFRTMSDVRDAAGRLLPDDQRLTRCGLRLRSSSLDELPQLVNVLKGDMSLVGPRPLLTEYLALYTPGQARRHEVRPGITGWLQVNGRNAVSWEDKFDLDVWYVDHLSLGLDLRILARTVGSVLSGSGVAQEGRVTADVFTGSPPPPMDDPLS